MEKMMGIWWTGPNKIELLHDVPVPALQPGLIKVKIAYSAICATDLHKVSMGAMNAVLPEGGMGLGHECAGVIEALGAGTERCGLHVGDKVALFPGSPCGDCVNCLAGLPQYCLHSCVFPTFTQYACLPPSGVYKLPDDADLAVYSLVEPAVCVIRAMDLSPIRCGQTVLVSGAGGIGSILLDMVVHSGAARITVSDPVAQKRENALAMGAQHVVDPVGEDLVARCMEITDGRGFDHVFEMSGAPQAGPPCLEVLARCGTVTYFALFPPTYELPVNLHSLYMKEGRIQTVFTSPALMPRAIDLMPRLQTDKIIGKVYDLADGMEAIEMFHKSLYPKIVLKCN